MEMSSSQQNVTDNKIQLKSNLFSRIKQQLSLQLNIEEERLLTKIGFNNCTLGIQTNSWVKPGREIYRDTVYH